MAGINKLHTNVGFTITPETLAVLDSEARRLGLNRGAYIRLVLLEKLNIQDMYNPTGESVTSKNITGNAA